MKRTVYLSGASIFSTAPRFDRFGLPLIDRNRSYVYFTSSDVSSRPFTGGLLCHRTPLRSLNTYVRSLGMVHDSARSPSTGRVPGTIDGPAFTFTSRLWVKDRFVPILWLFGTRCGSKPVVASSPRMRKTPPRFGVCAWAGSQSRSGSAAPAAAAPPSLRRSRRLNVVGATDASIVSPSLRRLTLARTLCPPPHLIKPPAVASAMIPAHGEPLGGAGDRVRHPHVDGLSVP